MAGFTQSFGAGNSDFWMMTLDSAGKIASQKTYGRKKIDEAYAVQPLKDGGYVMAGFTKSFGTGRSDLGIIRLNAYGNLIWQFALGTKNSEIAESNNLLQQTQDGGFIFAGTINNDANKNINEISRSDAWVLKLDSVK